MAHHVVVIGSGAGGAMAAYILAQAGIKPLVLEAGRDYNPREEPPMFNSAETAPLRDAGTPDKHGGFFDAHIIDHKKNPYTVADGSAFNWKRARMLGGRTNHWGRNVPRYGPNDFKQGSLNGRGKDWPISYKDIEPYYDKVEAIIGVNGGDSAYTNSPAPDTNSRMTPPPPRGYEMIFSRACRELCWTVNPNPTAILTENRGTRLQCFYSTSCKRGCTFDAAFQTPSSLIRPEVANGRMLLRTNIIVHRIEPAQEGESIKIHCLDKESSEPLVVEATYVVLAAGAMESCRILLNSQSEQHPNGLINGSGQVGRNITDSPSCGWTVQIPALENLPAHDEDGTSEPHVCLPWWIEGQEARYEAGINFFGGYRILPYGGGRKNPPDMNTFGDYLGIKPSLFGIELKKHMRRYYGSIIKLATVGAMNPNDQTFCEIDESVTDHWGIPVLQFHWQWAEEDLDRASHMYRTVKELVAQMSARILYDPSPADGRKIFSTGGSNNHDIGGAIMGFDAGTSVVNKYSQAWEVDNLYIADGAPFVNHAEKNPTLTIMALAHRLADQIVNRINADGGPRPADANDIAGTSGNDPRETSDGGGYGPDPEMKSQEEYWKKKLTEHQLATLSIVGDFIIPADDRSPAASQVGDQGVADFINEWVSAPYSEQQNHYGIVAHGIGKLDEMARRENVNTYRDLTSDRQQALFAHIADRGSLPAEEQYLNDFFGTLVWLFVSGYYTTTEGMADIGYVGNQARQSFKVPDEIIEELTKRNAI